MMILKIINVSDSFARCIMILGLGLLFTAAEGEIVIPEGCKTNLSRTLQISVSARMLETHNMWLIVVYERGKVM